MRIVSQEYYKVVIFCRLKTADVFRSNSRRKKSGIGNIRVRFVSSLGDFGRGCWRPPRVDVRVDFAFLLFSKGFDRSRLFRNKMFRLERAWGRGDEKRRRDAGFTGTPGPTLGAQTYTSSVAACWGVRCAWATRRAAGWSGTRAVPRTSGRPRSAGTRGVRPAADPLPDGIGAGAGGDAAGGADGADDVGGAARMGSTRRFRSSGWRSSADDGALAAGGTRRASLSPSPPLWSLSSPPWPLPPPPPPMCRYCPSATGWPRKSSATCPRSCRTAAGCSSSAPG